MSIRIGIVGISGFGGGEAMRLVANHPAFELIYAAGEGSAGSRLGDRFPGAPAKLAELMIEKWDPATLPKLDVLFASLPTGGSAEALARVPKDLKIVDIGGDHRYVEGCTLNVQPTPAPDHAFRAIGRPEKSEVGRCPETSHEIGPSWPDRPDAVGACRAC